MAFAEENLENGENYDPRLSTHCFLVVSMLRIDAMSSSGNGEDVPCVLSQARGLCVRRPPEKQALLLILPRGQRLHAVPNGVPAQG